MPSQKANTVGIMHGAKTGSQPSGNRLIRFFKENAGTIILFLLLLGYVGYQRFSLYNADKDYLEQMAPDFELLDLNGKNYRLSDLRGKYVLINFWATWCAPCRVEIPLLKSLYADMPEGRFELLGVASEDATTVRQFIQNTPMNYPVLLDDKGIVANRYAVQVYPSIVIVDPDGKIIEIVHGLNPLIKWKIKWMVMGSPL